MPGLTQLFGFLPLSSMRRPFPSKTRTVVADVEFILDVLDDDTVVSVNALLFYYVPYESFPPTDGLHFVWGKLCAMDKTLFVGDGFKPDTYEILIEADLVSYIVWWPMCFSYRNFL